MTFSNLRRWWHESEFISFRTGGLISLLWCFKVPTCLLWSPLQPSCSIWAVQYGSYLEDPCNFRPGKLYVPLSSLHRNEVGPTFEDESRLFSFKIPWKIVGAVFFPHSPLSVLMEFLLVDGDLMFSLSKRLHSKHDCTRSTASTISEKHISRLWTLLQKVSVITRM